MNLYFEAICQASLEKLGFDGVSKHFGMGSEMHYANYASYICVRVTGIHRL